MSARSAALICFGSLLVAAYGLGRYAAAQDLAGQRVLCELDGLFSEAKGGAWTLQYFISVHLRELAIGLSAWLLALAALAHAGAGRRAWPVTLGVTTIVAAVWGETLIFLNDPARGAPLLAAGFALALALGVTRSMARTPGFPPPPDDPRPVSRRLEVGELGALIALLGVALVARTYALNELPSGFDGEALNDMIMSRTSHGLREFFHWNFLANATGALQLLSQFASYHLFGTSIFALRYSAVVLGCTVVLLAHALVRRFAGARPALLAAGLVAFAPEQLYWSRFEVTHFIVAVLAGWITLLFCHALLRRLSLPATLAAALWMPFSRLLYIAGWVLFALPPIAALHSLLLGRNRRWKALYALPVLALGVVLWGATPSLLRWAFVDPELPFASPINVYGQSFVLQQGQLRETSAAGIVRAQVRSIAAHAGEIAVFFFDRCDRFTHWYIRGGITAEHVTVTNAALAVWAFCGLFYLLAQPGDARAVLLWALVGLGAAPALMSPIPFARRMLLVFVALPSAAALFAAALVRLADQVGARFAAALLRATAAVAAVLVAVTSAQSYFMLPLGESELLRQIRFARPLFAANDAIFHNLSFGEDGNRGLGVAFGNLDALLERDVDFQYVEPQHWLVAALRLAPRFDSYLTRLTLDEERRAALAAGRKVERAAFLLRAVPESEGPLRLLSQLYPEAARRDGADLVALSIRAEDAARRRTPRVLAAAASTVATPFLGFPANGRAASGEAARVTAGLLIEADDWYRWRLEPPCAAARLTLDDRRVDWESAQPLLRGVHALSLALPDVCPPVALTRSLVDREEATPIRAGDLFAPEVAALPAAQARAMATYDGFTAAAVLAEMAEPVVDFALDAQGGFSVLVRSGVTSSVLRLDAAGVRRSAWSLEGEEPVFAIAVAADGTHAVLSLEQVRWYSPDGALLAHTALSAGPACEIVFWGRERLLVNHPGRGSILVFDTAGEVVAEWKVWPGLGAPLYEPWALATDGAGRLFVRDSSRRAFLVSSPTDEFRPRSEAVFPVDAFEHGAAFAAGDRIVIPAASGFQVFRSDGTRLMARERGRDLGDGRFGRYPRAHAAGDVLYALDTEARRLWRIDW